MTARTLTDEQVESALKQLKEIIVNIRDKIAGELNVWYGQSNRICMR